MWLPPEDERKEALDELKREIHKSLEKLKGGPDPKGWMDLIVQDIIYTQPKEQPPKAESKSINIGNIGSVRREDAEKSTTSDVQKLIELIGKAEFQHRPKPTPKPWKKEQ